MAKTLQPTPLSFVDVAEKILREARKPLTHKELAKRAIEQKLVQTESETPDISMHVSIRGEMKRRETRGEPQRFVFLGNGQCSQTGDAFDLHRFLKDVLPGTVLVSSKADGPARSIYPCTPVAQEKCQQAGRSLAFQ